jgi:molybdopterin molybdotransferase
MLSVDQALQLILEQAQPLAPRRMGWNEALGLVLAEDIASDIDLPPHDKSVVDGYALQAASCEVSGAVLHVLEEITAGMVPAKTVWAGTATRIMTGAPIPAGADAVVMVEQTALLSDSRVRIDAPLVKQGQNITQRASSRARGEQVLRSGARLRAIELGILAEVGRTHVQATPRPELSLVITGNELVPCNQVPGPGQIRNSNFSLLTGLAIQARAVVLTEGGIVRDDSASLRKALTVAMQHHVVVVSGGVSMGVLDLVPQALSELGVEQVFHKVSLKPGKPLWFGVKRHNVGDRQTLVFGLPGNPVSTLVCFELFVRPAIQKLSGLQPMGLARSAATLTQDHQQRGERPTYWPAAVNERDGQRSVTPLPWKGSGDLATLANANCLAFFPGGDRLFRAGESIGVLHLHS